MDRMAFMTIISIIATLLYMLIAYYGYDRNIVIRNFANTESYIKNYSSIDKEKDIRIVLNILVNDAEIDKLKPLLLSLLDQTIRVDEIAISKYSNTNIKRTCDDYVKDICQIYNLNDSSDNLKAILSRERESDTILILLDNNVLYGKDFLEYIIEMSKKYPNNIIDVNNVILTKPMFYDSNLITHNKTLKLKYDENFNL